MSIADGWIKLSEEEIQRRIASVPEPKPKAKPPVKPTLTLAAAREPEDGSRVASVPLEPEDVATVGEALAGRRVRIGDDEVGFDKVTHARVTMRWTRATPAPPPPLVVSSYNPFALERLPGYDPEE